MLNAALKPDLESLREEDEEPGALRNEDAGRMSRIAFALHEACQPLMALQCRLEIGRMIGTAEGYEEAVREGLQECDRLLASVSALREEVRLGLEAVQG